MKTCKKNWLRRLVQWGVVIGIILTILILKLQNKPVDPEKYCPFGGIQALGSYFNNNSLACSMSMLQIMMGVVLAVGVILFGKLFCGYLCPVGTVGEAMGRLGRRFKVNFAIARGSVADSILRSLKYILLFIIMYMSVSSSELFCKNLDPYYALATGFKGEITVWMATITVAILFLGNFFIRIFWCKYICPLGALNNIFKFTWIFLAAVLLCWLFGLLGLPGAWVYILAATCIACCIIEIVKHRSCTFPLLHINRDAGKCNGCGLCAKKCPYAVPVNELTKVKHIDCTLCGECISSCNKDALSINGKRWTRWMPYVIIVVLFLTGLWIGKSVELPTINEHWGEPAKTETLKTYEVEGLRTIKCFGSSKAFSSKMQAVVGVYGVKTFVKRHAVVITYDPAVISTEDIDRAIFSPTLRKYRTPDNSIKTLRTIHLGVEGIHDRMDAIYFGMVLQPFTNIYGFNAQFACPVSITLYVDVDAAIDRKELEKAIEAKELQFGKKTAPINFTLKEYDDNGETVSADDFSELMRGASEQNSATKTATSKEK